MKRKSILRVAVHIFISLLVVVLAHFINVSLLSSGKIISPNEALFVEGVMFLLLGFLLLLGRGGLNLSSVKAAVLSAAAEALYGADTVGPAETLRRDSWRSKGFTRAGLVLLLTGVFMIAAYFLIS